MSAIENAQFISCGIHYKRGRYGFIYRWDGMDWVKADLDPKEIRTIDRIKKGNGRKPLPIKDGRKECRGAHGCGEWKPLTEFTRHGNGYYYSHCKACERKRQADIRRAA